MGRRVLAPPVRGVQAVRVGANCGKQPPYPVVPGEISLSPIPARSLTAIRNVALAERRFCHWLSVTQRLASQQRPSQRLRAIPRRFPTSPPTQRGGGQLVSTWACCSSAAFNHMADVSGRAMIKRQKSPAEAGPGGKLSKHRIPNLDGLSLGQGNPFPQCRSILDGLQIARCQTGRFDFTYAPFRVRAGPLPRACRL